MDITPLDLDDDRELQQWCDVETAVAAVDSPWVHPRSPAAVRGDLTHGWDGEPGLGFVGRDGGTVVAVGRVSTSERDNLDLAWLDVFVHPERRRRGLGTELALALEGEAAARGRTLVGGSCWESAGCEAFALGRGYERKQVGVNRRQYLADVDRASLERLHLEAAAAAADYELVRWPVPCPPEDLDRLAAMASAINEAPKDDLEYDDEVIDGDRVRAYEVAMAARGFGLHRLVARHRTTGELAGQTVVVVEGEHPDRAEQHDTSVVSRHRGHRLGALLKTGMLRWLAEVEPQVTEIDTWNAESNGFMIGVNEALGYRVMGRAFNLQRRL